MGNFSTHKARDLQPDAKVVLERLLGRTLGEEEEVTVTASVRRPVPSAEVRQAAADRMDRFFDRAVEHLKDVPESEFETAVDEALSAARRRS